MSVKLEFGFFGKDDQVLKCARELLKHARLQLGDAVRVESVEVGAGDEKVLHTGVDLDAVNSHREDRRGESG